MKCTRLLLAVLLCSGAYSSLAQNGIKPNAIRESHVGDEQSYQFEKLQNELTGTYQIKAMNVDQKIAVSQSILEEIKAERKEGETVVLDKGNGITIIIPSYNEINSANFSPLETVVYITTTTK